MSNDTAKYLISISGNDMKILLNELDKLSYYAKGGEITKEIIDNMATKCLQARIYDLSKYVVAGKSGMAYDVLNVLFEMKEEPIIILSAISGVYVDMYRVKCAKVQDLDLTMLPNTIITGVENLHLEMLHVTAPIFHLSSFAHLLTKFQKQT